MTPRGALPAGRQSQILRRNPLIRARDHALMCVLYGYGVAWTARR